MLDSEGNFMVFGGTGSGKAELLFSFINRNYNLTPQYQSEHVISFIDGYDSSSRNKSKYEIVMDSDDYDFIILLKANGPLKYLYFSSNGETTYNGMSMGQIILENNSATRSLKISQQNTNDNYLGQIQKIWGIKGGFKIDTTYTE